jgi:DASS family divalent anion:Na+ symporter
MRESAVKWLVVLACGAGIALMPPPEGVAPKSWTLLAIFIATIVGSIVQPLTGSAMVLVGVIATVVFGVLEPKEALKGYAEPVVWLVLAAFFLSVGMIKTGLGRRISLLFVRAMGRKTIGLGYALVATDFILASMVPSNGARNGGVILPIAQSVCETYDSRPGDGTEGKLGTFLMTLLYQCDVIICATFITGQASNLIIAKLAKETSGVELTYTGWFFAAIVPAIVSLAVVPFLIYRMTPPEIKETPEASKFAQDELANMGPVTRGEIIMLSVLVGVVLLWITKDSFHKLDTGIVALLGICILLFAKIIEWKDLMGETNAWSVFIWYGGLVNMATVLGETGLTKIFAEKMGLMTSGFSWMAALAILAFIYFYTHYFFASITAHVLAMFAPFLAVTMVAGAPAGLAVLLLAYFSNLNAGLTHFGTTPAPIYFGLGYVKQRTWWIVGLVVSIVNIAIWSTVGVIWWKAIGRF